MAILSCALITQSSVTLVRHGWDSLPTSSWLDLVSRWDYLWPYRSIYGKIATAFNLRWSKSRLGFCIIVSSCVVLYVCLISLHWQENACVLLSLLHESPVQCRDVNRQKQYASFLCSFQRRSRMVGGSRNSKEVCADRIDHLRPKPVASDINRACSVYHRSH